MDSTFLQSQITATQNQIVVYQDLLLALAANPARSYTINTGQTTETVNRWDVDKIHALIDSLYSRLDYLSAQQSGNVSTICIPGF